MTGAKARVAAFWLGLSILCWISLRHLPLLIRNPDDPAEWNFIGMAVAIASGAFILAASIPLNSPSSRYGTIFKFLKLIQQKVIFLGSFLYGISILLFGFQHLRYTDFIASMIPSWIPGHHSWAWATGIALISAGLSILLQIKMRLASMLLGIMILLWVMLLHVPRLISNPHDAYEWTSGLQALAISASAFVLNGSRKNQGFSTDASSNIKNTEVDRLIEQLKNERPIRTSQTKNLAVPDKYGVKFIHYWVDEKNG